MSEEAVVTKPPTALVNLARSFDAADKEVELLEEKLKEAKKKRSMFESKLVEEMITQQVQSFRSPNFGGFRQQICVYPNVKDKEVLGAWVRKKKLTFLYTTAIHGQKLKAFVKERMENGESVPPGVEPFLKTEIRRFR